MVFPNCGYKITAFFLYMQIYFAFCNIFSYFLPKSAGISPQALVSHL